MNEWMWMDCRYVSRWMCEYVVMFFQVSESQMAAEKFAMMCKKWRHPIPFFRFSPQLQDVISPGETDDQKLVTMMLHTKQYLIEQVSVINTLRI